METLQDIRKRIQSIENTRQITKSMRLVSTSKVQRARARMLENRPFLEEAGAMVKAVGALDSVRRNAYISASGEEKTEVQCSAVVVIGGDRGLCGGYNINAVKMASALMRKLGEVKMITVGAKSRDYCRRRFRSSLKETFTGISETPFYSDAKEIANLLLNWYKSGKADEIYVVYTKFENMLTHIPTAEKILPVEQDKAEMPYRIADCEPEGDAFLERAVPLYLTAFLYGAILESAVCEQSARITSMDSAARNADDMIRKLELFYNQIRQGAITQEIIEIVNGAGKNSGEVENERR